MQRYTARCVSECSVVLACLLNATFDFPSRPSESIAFTFWVLETDFRLKKNGQHALVSRKNKPICHCKISPQKKIPAQNDENCDAGRYLGLNDGWIRNGFEQVFQPPLAIVHMDRSCSIQLW